MHKERQPDLRAAATWESSVSKPAGVVARRRLIEAFDIGQPLTLVSAPAGFGKSVLVGSWVAGVEEGCTVVQMMLDDDAIDPRVFWASVVEGVRGGGVDVSGVAVGSADRHDLAFLAQHLEANRVPVVWVLD